MFLTSNVVIKHSLFVILLVEVVRIKRCAEIKIFLCNLHIIELECHFAAASSCGVLVV